jgi:hypothetical protein
MTVRHIAAGILRLEKLRLAVAREQLLIGQGDDPLLYLERPSCLAALRAAVSGLETARVVPRDRPGPQHPCVPAPCG